MSQSWKTALEGHGVPLITGEPMSRRTTFRIGGPAELFAAPDTVAALESLLAVCRKENIPYFILGKGSNLLVGDKGIPGLTIAMENLSGITVEGGKITAQAGAALSTVCIAARQAGLTGLEFAYGIPGQVGGGVYMNAGAYGGELRDVLTSVTFLDEEGNQNTLPVEALEMGYRHSIFCGKGRVILSAEFRLKADPDGPQAIGERMEDILRRRKEKQPLEWPSAGSTFKRPEGHFAGELIMNAGLRGFQLGGARVSDKHCGFVINTGNASAADIMDVIWEVQRRVKDRFEVDLEPEVVFLGAF